jgi:broad specificity phosphatase PhoE
MPILLIRHGNTTYDDKVDALLDPPLTKEGVDRLERTGKFLQEKGILFSRIISSPLQRTVKAASILGHGAKITTHQCALPWHLGDLMGKLNKEVDPDIHYLEEFPYIAAPHGESYAKFYSRWTWLLGQVMEYSSANPDKIIGILTHSRNIDALQEVIGGADLGHVKAATPEASVTLLSQDEAGDWSYRMIWEGK